MLCITVFRSIAHIIVLKLTLHLFYDFRLKMSQKTKAVVGIDLGTTFSCVGQYKEKRETVEICPSETGNRIVPSFVTFTDDERLVGDGAKNYRATRPENTIFGMYDLSGFNNVSIVNYFLFTTTKQVILSFLQVNSILKCLFQMSSD